MSIFKIILTILALTVFIGCSGTDVKPIEELNVELAEEVDTNITIEDANLSLVDVNIDAVDFNVSIDENITTIKNIELSDFEKLFVNHTAYIYYRNGINDIYLGNYKSAYANAMKAKDIFDNTDDVENQVIALPYMPSYLRESAYTPIKIYYKIVKPRQYELKRLITKAKLISPPIASVVIKRTSTYMEIILKNYGDLPLDDFEVLLNDESISKYEKILPNELKTLRVELAPKLYEISFKEKYGFAPNSIMLSEDE